MVYKDSITFTLNEADLTGMQVGQSFKTPERDVPRTDGLKWLIQYYPTGVNQSYSNNLSVFLNVTKAIKAKYTFKVDRSSIQMSLTSDFVKAQGWGVGKLASHDALRSLFVNGTLSITSEVEFNVCMPFTFLKPSLARYCDHLSPDFEFFVGSNRVQVHKNLLTLISPVFNAMLSHDTAESRSSEVEIKDFDFEIVKNVFDYCYGRELETLTVETVVDMLRFADKYDIKAVSKLIEELPQLFMTVENFPVMIRFAHDYSRDYLFNDCCEFFKEHQKDIVKTEKFATLSPLLVDRLLMQAFDLKTEFDALRHAHTNGIEFILDPLEQPILQLLSLDTFCDTVSYAWDCSRDGLKISCAKFFNEHLTEINNMKSFVNLSPSVVQGVMKLRCDDFVVPSDVKNVLKLSVQEPQKIEVRATMEQKEVTILSFICYVYSLIVETIANLFHFD